MTASINWQKQPNGVGILTIDQPKSLNAMTLKMMQSFADTVYDLQKDEDLQEVIIRGAGTDAFCSGGDLAELRHMTTQQQVNDMITLMGDALFALENLPVPVIAAVNGYALGGGSEIAMACDLRIVDEDVRFGFVQIRQAVTPGWGGGQRLLRAVGYSRAMQLLLSGDVLQADQMLELGLVQAVVPQGTAVDEAMQLANKIAEQPPKVVRAIKQLLQAGVRHPYATAIQQERDLFPLLWLDEPHWQAVNKFLERQQAKREET